MACTTSSDPFSRLYSCPKAPISSERGVAGSSIIVDWGESLEMGVDTCRSDSETWDRGGGPGEGERGGWGHRRRKRRVGS